MVLEVLCAGESQTLIHVQYDIVSCDFVNLSTLEIEWMFNIFTVFMSDEIKVEHIRAIVG